MDELWGSETGSRGPIHGATSCCRALEPMFSSLQRALPWRSSFCWLAIKEAVASYMEGAVLSDDNHTSLQANLAAFRAHYYTILKERVEMVDQPPIADGRLWLSCACGIAPASKIMENIKDVMF
uniref:Uncharacterized protein n=1 Tax=Leersia perrieri TaxID=77586 RepID=A0A0D9VYW4_9ORYZ